MAVKTRQRFAVGANVRVIRPVENGVVTQLDASPSVMGEYMHTIQTQHGSRREPGSNIELIPTPQTNAGERTQNTMTNPPLLLPEQAIQMLRAQLAKTPEELHHSDPDAYTWDEITLKIIERSFGEHSRNASHFGSSVSYTPETDQEAQEQYVRHIQQKKAQLRQFIQELEIIPPHRPPVDVTREGVFFAGQTFDAMSAAARILATVRKHLMLVDGYIGADALNILPTSGVALNILTKGPLTPRVNTLCQAFKAQHGTLTVKTTSAFHDRFLVIDDTTVYHFGASIKDLGKKTFMFSLIEEPDVVATIQTKITAEWNGATTEV